MRFSWLVMAGVCSWFLACSSSSHKKVLTCDAAQCGPDLEAGAPSAGESGVPNPGMPDPSQGGAPDMTPDGGPDTAGAGGGASEAGAGGTDGPASDSELEIAIEGNGTVTVSSQNTCSAASCRYATSNGTRFTLEAKPGADSRFVGWSGDCSGTNASTGVLVNGGARCAARFVVERAVSLSVTASGGGSVASNPDLACTPLGCKGDVDNHSFVTIIAKAAPNYRFVGWSGGPECAGKTQASLSLEITQDLSCNAAFAQQFTVAVSALGALAQVGVTSGNCSALSCTADAGAKATFRAEPAAGFRFTGWSGDPQCTGTANPLDIASVGSDITCVANYAGRLTATGLVAAGVSGSVVASSASVNANCTGNSCTLDAGTTATLLAPTLSGSRLSNWTGAGCNASNQSGNGISVTPTVATGNITCTANYVAGVSVTGTVVGATGSVLATSTTANASCGPGACSIDAGGNVTLTAPNLLPQFRFAGWSGDAGCAGSTLVLPLVGVATSKSCSANYVQQFTIASVTGPGGTVTAKNGAALCSANSCTVDAGTTVTLTATPDTANGYHFVSWTGPGCTPAANNPLSLSNLNATCTASFALNTFTIAATAGINGTVTATPVGTPTACAGASCTVNFGVSVNLVASPALNYHFAGWTGAGCAPPNSPSLTLTNVNVNCSAAFLANTLTAAVVASPPTGGSVNITGPSCAGANCNAVPFGQPVTVTAAANAGWFFAGWSANCGGGPGSPNTVTINVNTICTANFQPRVTAVAAPTGAGTISASGTPNATCITPGDPAGCAVDVNGSVTLVARASSNAVFLNWTGDCSGTNPSLTVSGVTAPKNCTANFYRLWAQSTGQPGTDVMGSVVALGDGSVAGLGLSAVVGSRTDRLALVGLDANSGNIAQSTLISDLDTGTFIALGLTTSLSQRSITALAVHSTAKSKLPFLHNEEKKWDFEYDYGTGGSTNTAGGEVISTTDGGYAFTVGFLDPSLPGVPQVSMGHLTKVDASGVPQFDTKFCAKDAKGSCLPTLPVDVVQDATNKTYTVLSQVQTPTGAILLTTIDELGTVKGSTLYVDSGQQPLNPAQFVASSAGDGFVVVGSRIEPRNGTTSGFFAKLTRPGTASTWAFALDDSAASSNEDLVAIARSGTSYGLAGGCPDLSGGSDAWFVLIADDGTLKTQISYGAKGSVTAPANERANAITLMPAGGFALGGNTTSWGFGLSDMWTLRVDPNGDIAFNRTLVPPATLTPTAFNNAKLTFTASETDATLPASRVVPVVPTMTTAAGMFKQVAQAP